MGIAITKMSKNGQVVIPAEVREDAKLAPAEKFIVINKEGIIILKSMSRTATAQDFRLIEKILKSEKQIKEGKYVKANTKMSEKEIDKLLME
ncbi:MAG: AbrB/MazE/SpoVT family DNA-binding domain-containing protein [Nanoarchaeota archaeon]|nr:AbrB/MazE/SpoVT family DNA-binding domain-containing protein [Nanoarchaeota archaeon]